VAYCGVCTLEQRLYSGERKIFYPIVPGHESSGTIVKKGSRVHTHHQEGQKVALDLVNRCHVCEQCASGNSNLCENKFNRGQRVLGAFSEYIIVRPDQAFVLPDDAPLEELALSEPLACCIRSLEKVNVQLGEDILISGGGTMGMLHLKVARAMGARVIVSDIDQSRLDLAASMGADDVVDANDLEQLEQTVKEKTGGKGVSCCVITTPSQSALDGACKVLRSGGRVNIYTSYNDKPALPMDLNTLHRKEIQVTGTEGRTERDFLKAVRALTKRIISVEGMISNTYTLDSVEDAIREASSGSTLRVLVKVSQ
jgi:L-iditol 2-dehydrogenase